MKRTLILGVALFFCSAPFAHAASLYMDPAQVTLNRGDTIQVAVRLDTAQGECVNTVDAVIHYPKNIELVDVSRGDSIMSMWVQPPTINKTNRTVSFAGGIPNGYCGRISGDPMLTNVVLDLIFQSPGLVIGSTGSSTASITFDPNTQVLLNNGRGTPAPLTMAGAKISLSPRPGLTQRNDWNSVVTNDKTPPQPFAINLERTPNAFSNSWFITFNTTDKQSGIDHYEVMEEPLKDQKLFLWGQADAPWVPAKSPYVLKDQSLNSTIYVKAVDKAGNDYIAKLVPNKSDRTFSPQLLLEYTILGGLGFLALLLVGGIGYGAARFVKRRRAQRAPTDEVDSEDEEYEDDADNLETV